MPQKPYPVLAPRAQIPVIELRPSLTVRILTPLIVLSTCFLLLLCVVAGIVLGVEFFGHRGTGGNSHTRDIALRVGTGFLIVGVSFSFVLERFVSGVGFVLGETGEDIMMMIMLMMMMMMGRERRVG